MRLFVSWSSLANAGGSWLSYSGIVGILFPEQLRAVTEGLCRCHIIYSVSVLKVSVCAAGVGSGVHRWFSGSWTFFWLKRNRGRFVGIFFRKEKYFFCKMSILVADISKRAGHYRPLLDRSVTTRWLAGSGFSDLCIFVEGHCSEFKV